MHHVVVLLMVMDHTCHCLQVIEGGAGLYDHEAATTAPCCRAVRFSATAAEATHQLLSAVTNQPGSLEQHEDTERVVCGQRQ